MNIQVSRAQLTVGTPAVKGLTGAQATTATFTLAADMAVMRSATTGALQFYNNITAKTVNIGTAGPAAGGRDQSGAFSNGATIHAYLIGKPDGTVAGIASTVAPTTGPTLPTGYDKWAYATSFVLTAGGTNIPAIYFRGAQVRYADGSSQVTLNNGTSTSESTIDVAATIASFVPANALTIFVRAQMLNNTGTAGTVYTLKLRVLTTVDYAVMELTPYANSASENLDQVIEVPNVSLTILYLVSNAAMRASTYINGYTVPN